MRRSAFVLREALVGKTSRQPARYAAGGIVYRYADDQLQILLIHDKYGHWTMPKGHLKRGESEAQAALREVFEETAVLGTLGPLVERITYTISKNRAPRTKHVTFFLLHAADGPLVPQEEEGIIAAEWFAPAAAIERVGYKLVREVLMRGLQMLASGAPAQATP